jgi:hypothetical protein
MTRRVTGNLVDGAGAAVTTGALVFIAQTNYRQVIKGQSTTEPIGALGLYDITLEENTYKVYYAPVLTGGVIDRNTLRLLGESVVETGPAIDLATLLTIEGTVQEKWADYVNNLIGVTIQPFSDTVDGGSY